jgi:hypothetical protein
VSNRDRSRQGLVYGPVRPSGPRDRGRILGNVLGLLVVVITVGVLGSAIYILLQERSATPPPSSSPTPAATSPTNTPASEPTPTGIVVVSPAATSSAPTIAPTLAATDAPITPAPTIAVPAVQIGPGFITFGTTADASFHVTDPRSTFAIDQPMVWSAYLTETANAADLRIRILKLDPTAPDGQTLIREDPVTPNVQNVRIFFRRLHAIGATSGTGLYTVQYVRGDQILAQGSFLIQ